MNLDQVGGIHDLVIGVHWSSECLVRESNRRASVLRRFAPASGKMFVIAHANSPSFFADLFAIWKVGGCAVCVNAGLTEGELDNVVGFVKPAALLVAEQSEISSDMAVVCTATENAGSLSGMDHSGGPDDPALMLFTSGTTGEPKGVVHSYRSIFSRLALNQTWLGRETLARSLCVLPTHFGHGLIGNCLTPLLSGCDVYLMHGAGLAATARLGATIDEHRISFMSSVPSFWKVALRLSPPPAAGTLKRVNIGSAPLSADLWREVIIWAGTDRVANMYGITETANWIGGALASEYEPEDGLLGKPWGGMFAVRNAQGKRCSEGEGEILLRAPSLMSGYYRRADLTDEVLTDGWYATGDMGILDDEGVLRMTGRNKYVINIAGIKIYPEELDLLLERHPDVQEACAFGLADPISGESVAAAVVLRNGANILEKPLIDWVRDHIRTEAVPRRVYVIAEIPKTDRGKLNRANVADFCTRFKAHES
jgi:acyl-coenzyme A synthetase/AMP-(fatty) acid ligase